MKKLFFLIATLLLCSSTGMRASTPSFFATGGGLLSTSGTSGVQSSPFAQPEYSLPENRDNQLHFQPNNGVWRIANSTSRNNTFPKNATVESVAGFYMETDTLKGGSVRKSSTEIKAETSGDYNVRVVQLGGLELAGCYATVSGSEIIIPAGLYCQAKDNAGNTYPAYLVPVNLTNNTIDLRGTVKGSIDASGNIRFGSWGIFAMNNGEIIGQVCVMVNSDLEPCNATMECISMSSGEKVSWGLKITQGYQNEITVENFGNTGASVNITLYHDKTVQIVPYLMGSIAAYGNFYNVALSANGKANLDTLLTGTMPDLKTINLPAWGITDMSAVDMAVARYSSGVIRMKDAITLPAKLNITLQGSGTENAPYLLNNYNDLRWLAQYIRDGGDTQGKYYRLTNDISCSSTQYAFESLAQLISCNEFGYGTNPFVGHPFMGHLDGDGHKITDISIETGNVSCVALIGWVGPGATIKNLVLTDNMLYSEGNGLSPLAGLNQGIITNCRSTNNGILAGGCHAGGICAINKGRIEQSYSQDEILCCGTTGSVCGVSHGTIRGCEGRSNIAVYPTSNQLHRYVGGLAGQIIASWGTDEFPGVIEDCVAAAQITNTNSSDAVTAGLVGSLLSSSNKAPAVLRNSACIAAVLTTAVSSSETLSGMAAGIVGTMSYASIENVLGTGIVMSKNMLTGMGSICGYVSSGQCSIKNIISAVQIQVPGAFIPANKALFGNVNSTIMSWCSNVYYDQQMFAMTYNDMGYTGAKNTTDLIGANAPSGISSEEWAITEGLYPRPVTVADKEISQIAAAPVMLAQGEVSNMIRHNFTVGTANNVKWSAVVENGLSNQGNGVTIQGNTVTVRDDYASDVLSAYITTSGPMKNVMIDIVPSTLFKGAGTQEDPYQLTSVIDLKNLADAIHQYGQTYEGYYFKVMNDIDCQNDEAFRGIATDGVATHLFNGEIDGAGFTIDNMNINRLITDITGTPNLTVTPGNVGFIGRLGANGVLKNLNFGAGCKVRGGVSTAGVAGVVLGRLENCTYAGRVEGHGNFTGGIVGQHPAGSNGITGCLFTGTVYGSKNYTAGVVGANGALVEYCMNSGKVICDTLSPGDKITDCRYTGGVCGYVQSGIVRHCVNLGHVQTNTSAGGIAGYCSGAVRIDSCLSMGSTSVYLSSGTQGALAGSLPASNASIIFTDCVFDMQVSPGNAVGNDSRKGCLGMQTKDLTSGTAIEAFGNNWLNYTSARYPVPARFADNPQVKALRSIVLTLGADQNVGDVYGTAALSNPEGIKWTVSSTENVYSISDNTLTVNDFTSSDVACGTVTATLGDVTRNYLLKSLPTIFSGQGSKESPFQIKTKEDMAKLAAWVNDKNVPFNGRHFQLVNDLDYAGDTTYIPIGNIPAVFGGHFDGAGHTIRNLEYTPKAPGAASLFGVVNNSGGIYNLTLRDGIFHSSQVGAKGATSFVYTLSGRLENCMNYNEIDGMGFNYGDGVVHEILPGGVASHCNNYGRVTAKLGASGGVCGEVKADGLLEYCENHGELNIINSNVGGIAARCSGTISHCTNFVNLTSPKNTLAGIVSTLYQDGSVLDCVNHGNLTMTGSNGYIAGIAQSGSAINLTVMRCVNYGNISCEGSSSVYAAGILNRSGRNLRMDSCINHGDITTNKGQYTGGLIAYLSGNATARGLITNCYNYGKITGNGNHIGGLAGYITVDSVAYCGNYGAVVANTTAKMLVGGLAAYTTGTAWKGCFNCGDVTTAAYNTGGCFGSFGTSTNAYECANTGNVKSTATTGTATNFTAAGFASNIVSGNIVDCFNLGNVEGNKYVAGFVGRCQKNSTFTNNYTAGQVIVPEGVTTAYPFIGSEPTATNYNNNYFDVYRWGRDNIESVGAMGLETRDLLGKNLSDAWLVIPATYPTLSCMSDIVPINFAAAQILYGADDFSQHVVHTMTIGLPAGLSWVCSDNLRIEGDKVILLVKNQKNIPAWLKKTAAGNMEETYNLVLMNDGGVNSLELGEPLSREYYTTGGLRVVNPAAGQIVIEKCVYKDGTVMVTRKVIR